MRGILDAAELKQIARSLRRAPIFTAAASFTLALGIAATATIFSVVYVVLLRPLPYRDPDRLVSPRHTLPGLGIPVASQSLGTYFQYKRTSRTLSSIGVYIEESANLSGDDRRFSAERVHAALVSASLFSTLGVTPARGRAFTEAEDVPKATYVAIIGDGLWRRRFGGDPDVIGRSIRVNGEMHRVVGVMPAGFDFPRAGVDLWLPLRLDPATTYAGAFGYEGVARMAPGASVAQVETELNQLLGRVPESYPNLFPRMPTAGLLAQAKARAIVRTMREDAVGRVARLLWIVAAVVGVVLFVACANVANLLLVRAQSRTRDSAVRVALGASPARLRFRFFVEGIALATIGGALGLGLALLTLRVLVRAGAGGLPRLEDAHASVPALVITGCVTLFVGGLCGVLPGLRMDWSALMPALKDGGRSATADPRQRRARQALVVVQVALAMLLLAGSGLLVRTAMRLRAVRPGFDPSGTVAFTLSLPKIEFPHARDVAVFYDDVVDKMRSLPGVEDVGIVSRLPLIGAAPLAGVHVERYPVDGTSLPVVFAFPVASPGYFRAMRIPLIAGHVFSDPRVPASAREVVVSRAFAEFYWHDPTGARAIGERIRLSPSLPWSTIVGVVESVRDTSLQAPPVGAVYSPLSVAASGVPDSLAPFSPSTMSVVLRTRGDPLALVPAVRGAITAMNPNLPIFDVSSMSEVLARSMAQTNFALAVCGAAAAITLVLGAVGLYGVVAYAVSLRTRELGLRMALGAEPRMLHAMIIREGLSLALVGVTCGVVAFLVLGQLMRGLLFGVSSADPVTLGVTVAILVSIGVVASWLPARRAARVDPLEALRAE